MHNEDGPIEITQEAKKLHTKYSLIFLAVIVAISLIIGAGFGALGTSALMSKNDAKAEKTENVEKTQQDAEKALASKADKEASKESLKKIAEYPTYEVQLLEEPTITMWQFTHAIAERDAALIGNAVSSLNDERTDYDIVFMKEPSLIADDYNYYLCIKGNWDEEYICFKVNEVIIDDVWNTLQLDIADWNQLTKTEGFSPSDYNKFQALGAYLKDVSEDYIVRKIPAPYFVVKGELLTPNV